MKLRGWILAGVAGSVLLAACEQKHFKPPSRTNQVAEAEMEYTPTVFDTVKWVTDSVRELDGNAVYAASCRKCHGTMGEGGTLYDRSKNLQVPSLVEPHWRFDQIDSLRKWIWVGHAGMPTFGIAGINARDIDGVAYYLLEGLRPDVLGKSARH